jgi:hypothetical protein
MDGTLRPDDRRAKKYVVSSTLDRVDWNAELVGGIWRRPFRNLRGRRVEDGSWQA